MNKIFTPSLPSPVNGGGESIRDRLNETLPFHQFLQILIHITLNHSFVDSGSPSTASLGRGLGGGVVIFILFFFSFSITHAQQTTITEVCPAEAMVQRGVTAFEPGGIILTTFDRANIWVYNIDRQSRYPLPDTRPCGTNCHLSHDAQWITYLNAGDKSFSKMRLDGTQRTPLTTNATDVLWWSDDTLLIWTPAHRAYLQVEGADERERLDSLGVVSVQPGGTWALVVEDDGTDFNRVLIDLETRGTTEEKRISLGREGRYFNTSAWSPQGEWLAYVADGQVFGVSPDGFEPVQWTFFDKTMRIGGQTPAGGLSWSPDGTKLAFWAVEQSGADPFTETTGEASLYLIDITTNTIRHYCGYNTIEHTPNPPRLVWSPDSTHVAFGGNIQDDERGYLLLALNVESGVFTELSEGIYPAMGSADVIAWGLPPR